MSEKISAFVITCDRDPAILRAVLTAARFADELVILDKGRRDFFVLADGPELGDALLLRDDWSPTVEPSRIAALAACSHDWIVCLDDDEILSPACAGTFRDFIAGYGPRVESSDGLAVFGGADVLGIPIKHYILGRHDPRAYYWPEWRPTLFRRGAVEFGPTVHGGTWIVGKAERLPPDHPAFITHLSHPDIATWLEKTNRYTSQPDRAGYDMFGFGPSLSWAVNRLSVYATRSGDDPHIEAVALLRGLYDIIDGLKQWEVTQPDGNAAFAEIAKAEIERLR